MVNGTTKSTAAQQIMLRLEEIAAEAEDASLRLAEDEDALPSDEELVAIAQGLVEEAAALLGLAGLSLRRPPQERIS